MQAIEMSCASARFDRPACSETNVLKLLNVFS